ncbi:RNA polymerase sigma factor [Paenibacillus sp. Cedars]|uniref:RNA polymerase sigma factor n=1 Tax=Paenibacillus sp. Cedars TaxID=1980674 RepID=UPI0020A4D5ED|nr:sigma-70 family RNA polymerase sigma factor [Paenibacillus sp. Cedars]
MSNRLQLLLAADFADLSEPIQEEIYYEFYDLVYGQILYVVRDHAAVEDIIQESFIKVITSKPNFEMESKMRGWLRVVAKNSTMNYLRKNKKYRNLVIPLSSRQVKKTKQPARVGTQSARAV